MNKTWSTALYLTLALTLTSGFSSPWTPEGDPNKFSFKDENYEMRFDQLPGSGRADGGDGHIPYSDTFWPAKQGGIAVRYLDPARESAFTYIPHTLAELRSMSQEEIVKLSPAEKFDIYRGRYDYPLLQRVRRIYSPDKPSWWGICHGWTPSAANFPEPNSTKAVNADGIVIPFGSSDVKGIMSFYYAWEAAQFKDDDTQNFGWDKDGKYWQKDPAMIYFLYRGVGARNEHKGLFGTGFGAQGSGRKDLNPGTLHVIMSNLLGRYNRSFNADVDATDQVWNQPVYGYSSTILKTKKGDNGGKRVLVETKFNYIVESTATFTAHGKTQLHDEKTLRYWLDLNEKGEITGGDWVKNIPLFGRHTQSLDFIWRASRVPFLGEFAPLNDLYKTNARTATSYAMGPNYTPGIIDVSASDEAAQYPAAAPAQMVSDSDSN